MTARRRPEVERGIRLADNIRKLADKAKDVRILAAKLATQLPKLRERVATGAKDRNSSEDMVALDGNVALQKLRERSPAADRTVEALELALKDLDNTYQEARSQGARDGGYGKDDRTTLFALSHKTAKAVAWVPPLSDDPRTVRRRVEDALNAGRLPAPLIKKKPNLRAQLKASQAWHDQQNYEKELARQKAAAAAASAPKSAPVEGRPQQPAKPAQRPPQMGR
jgi:hypothetical protein